MHYIYAELNIMHFFGDKYSDSRCIPAQICTLYNEACFISTRVTLKTELDSLLHVAYIIKW